MFGYEYYLYSILLYIVIVIFGHKVLLESLFERLKGRFIPQIFGESVPDLWTTVIYNCL